MHLLQDANSAQLQELLEFSCVKKIRTVHDLLEEKGALNILREKHIEIATRVIVPEGKSRPQINREIAAKNRAIKQLASAYESRHISKDDIETCLYSVGDNNCLLYFDRDPIDAMIKTLLSDFHPDR